MMSRIPVRTSKIFNNATVDPSIKMDDSAKFLKLQREFEDYRSDKEREIAGLEDELEELESKLAQTQQTTPGPNYPGAASEQLEAENEFLKSKVVELEKKLEEFPDVSALEEQIKNLTTENDELNNELDEQLEQIKTMKSNLKKAKNAAKNAANTSNDQIVEELKHTISKHEESQKELTNKLSDSERNLKEKTKEFQNLRESNDESAREVDLLKRELLKCESEIDALRNDVTVFEKENEKNLTSIESYKNELESYAERVILMENEKEEDRETVAHKFKSERQQQQKEIDSLNKNLTLLGKRIEDISTEKQSLMQENSKLKEKQRQLEIKMKSFQDVEELKKENSRRASEITTLKSEKMKAYELLKEKKDDYEESLKFYEHKMASLESQIADYRSKIENQETEKFLMSKKLQSSEDEIVSVKNKLESQVEETKGLQESLNELRKLEQEKEGKSSEESHKKRKLESDNLEENDQKAESLAKWEKDLQKMKEDLNKKGEELTRREKELKPVKRSSVEDEENRLLAQHQKELENLSLIKLRNDERRTIEHQMSDLLSEKESLELRVTYLTREIEEKNKSLEEIWNDSSRNRKNNRMVADLQLTNRQLKSTVDQLEFDLDDVRKENKKLKSTIEDLRGDISEKESQIFSMNNNLSSRDQENQSLRDDLGEYQWRFTNDLSFRNTGNANFPPHYSSHLSVPRAGVSPRVSTPSSEVRRSSSFFNFNQPFLDMSTSNLEE